jgi:tetratricopeptide (TPR) repeat protein
MSFTFEGMFDAFTEFVLAKTWNDSRRVLNSHPELLDPNVQQLLLPAVAQFDDPDVRSTMALHLEVLRRCRIDGIEKGLASAQEIASEQTATMTLPADLTRELVKLMALEAPAASDPQLHLERIRQAEHLLSRVDGAKYPEVRASILDAQASAYAHAPTGDRQVNLRKAIAIYNEALKYGGSLPELYAVLQNGLGDTYSQLAMMDGTVDFQLAVNYYKEALRFYTPDTNPLAYAGTQNHLGNLYLDINEARGSDTIAQAMACFHEALRFFTVQAQPLEYARNKYKLGQAYAALPGDDPKNLQQAISYFEEALHFINADNEPDGYVQIKIALGEAYARI